MRLHRALAGAVATAAAVAGTTLATAAPALAGPEACAVSPPAGQFGASPASVTCPAGAGSFTFRVAAVCADGYPVLRLSDRYGPWVTTSQADPTTSSVPCPSSVPGSGFVWSAAIEVA